VRTGRDRWRRMPRRGRATEGAGGALPLVILPSRYHLFKSKRDLLRDLSDRKRNLQVFLVKVIY
jgi:hypothetical protein